MREKNLRLFATLMAMLVGVAIFVYIEYFSKSYLQKGFNTLNDLDKIQLNLNALDGELLKSTYFLYYNYDRINRLILETESIVDDICHSEIIHESSFVDCKKRLSKFKNDFEKYRESIERFLTINASIKNSVIYLPRLQLEAYSRFDTTKADRMKLIVSMSRINAGIFLSKNALDKDFLEDISRIGKDMGKEMTDLEKDEYELLRTYLLHLNIYLENFPIYLSDITSLVDNSINSEIAEVIESFKVDLRKKLTEVKNTTRILVSLYILSLIVLVYFIILTDRENRDLHNIKEKLYISLITDQLTGLKNRRAFAEDIANLEHPTLILVNIDRFKHFNEFYGSNIGDKVLQEIAKILKKSVPKRYFVSLYRLGGDDFGLLYHCDPGLQRQIEYYNRLLQYIVVDIDGLNLSLSFTLGASRESDRLLETADIALKYAKSSKRERYAVYSEALDNRKEIEQNLEMIRMIKDALTQKKLIPYYQPILNLHTMKIEKFESLARISTDKSYETVQPGKFLTMAKEAKLSGEITFAMLGQTLETAREFENYNFSINLSTEDMASEFDSKKIISLLEKNRDICDRIILEILESEEILDYGVISDFIKETKSMGCRIAIDDFGSGYSNFEKLLKLDIDILKIDGSLISRLDSDEQAEMIVRTIMNFAKFAGVETIAEYVHSEKILEIVKEIGIDYAQGYIIGKAENHPLTDAERPR